MNRVNSIVRSNDKASLSRIDQVCILVDDLDQGVVEYSEMYFVKHWRGYLYSPDTVPELGYRGGAGQFSMWIALSDSDPQIELVQSVSGPSIYTEWLEEHGPGFHHFGTFTNDLAADVEALQTQGLVICQWGRGYGVDGDGCFVYFDSVDRLGVFVELIDAPQRRTPDREWLISQPTKSIAERSKL